MIYAQELNIGDVIELDDDGYEVIETQHVKPGKGASYVRTKLRKLGDNSEVENSFRPTEHLEQAHIDHDEFQYLYNDPEKGDYVFLDLTTYEQIALKGNVLGDSFRFVKENEMVTLCSYRGNVFTVRAPLFVSLEVVKCAPALEGDCATNVPKPAVVETGVVVNVPVFVEKGEIITIDTRTGEYLSRL